MKTLFLIGAITAWTTAATSSDTNAPSTQRYSITPTRLTLFTDTLPIDQYTALKLDNVTGQTWLLSTSVTSNGISYSWRELPIAWISSKAQKPAAANISAP